MKKKNQVSVEAKKVGSNKRGPVKEKDSFTPKVMEKPLLSKFKMPQLRMYSSKGEPHDHIQNYELVMLLYRWEDAIMC